MEIFHDYGLAFLSRWAHVLSGITWIGLLYYFNFVQVPAFAELEPGTRNQVVDRLASRALWWFRWAAVSTLVFGILIYFFTKDVSDDPLWFSSDYMKSAQGVGIYTGIIIALVMFANVWLVIWPNQRRVIENARNVLAGGEADAGAAAAGRKGLLASRQNTIFSFTMLFFMVGTSHFFGNYGLRVSGGDRALWYLFALVVIAALELNALGIIGTTGADDQTNWMYERHDRAIGVALVLVVVFYLVWELILG